MKASEQIKEFIKVKESFSQQSYLCPAGVLTVGWGTTENVNPTKVYTVAECIELFELAVVKRESWLSNHIDNLGFKLYQHEFDAIFSFAWNLGLETVSSNRLIYQIVMAKEKGVIKPEEFMSYRQFCFHDNKYKGMDISAIRFIFRKYISVNNKASAGLFIRRSQEALIFCADWLNIKNEQNCLFPATFKSLGVHGF